MNTNTIRNTLKSVCRFKASLLTASVFAALAMTHAGLSEAGNEIGSNTWYGDHALASKTTGINNSAFGDHALTSNTTGENNSAFGDHALTSNTTGENNSAFGYQALFSNTTGNLNTANGYLALYSNTIGHYNAAYGSQALLSNTIGNGNTAFGYAADVTTGALTSATAIGYNAKVNSSNKVRIGNTSVTRIEGQVPWTSTSDKRLKSNIAGSRYFCESLFWASQPKQAAKT